MAKEVIGDVPVFVCSAAIGGDADQYLTMHRWALREGVDGLIRNHYGHGGREERHTLASLARWMANVQQESGCTKHLWANEVGYVGPHVTDDDWAANEAAELDSQGSFGSQWAFPSRDSLREMLVLLTHYGYRGFNRFLMNPSAPRASREVKWMAQLRPEITSMVVRADGPPGAVEGLTREQAIAAARADGRIRRLLRGVEPARATAEFSERWDVWLVRFFAGDRPLGFASVSRQGEVLEVGGPEGQEREEESREEDGVGRQLTYRFPKTARIHIPDAANTATLVTCDLAAREPYRSRLHYQFVLAEDQGDWTSISHRSAVSNDPFPFVTVQATDDSLLVMFHAVRPESVQRASFATMDEAVADHQCWLEQAYGVGRIGRHPNKPAWLADLCQVFTVDLWRSHGEITQSFEDVVGLLDELHQAGASEGVLLYLCGWSGPYDARYPEYRPALELGGDEGFRRLVETAHRYGCRVMIHTCPVAFDPWLPSFSRFEDCALRGTDHPGGYRGWPGGYQGRELDFDSGRRTVNGGTVLLRVPRACEAYLTVGGFGAGRPQITVGNRTLALPVDAPDPYTVPFTFFFDGESRIQFSAAPVGLWCRVHGARRFVHVWTYPFVAMDPKSAEWRDYFTAEVTEVVRDFGLDAVHLDAHSIGGSIWDCLPLFQQVMEALPGVAFSAEEGLGEVGLAVFGLTQSCRLGNDEMLPHSPVCARLTNPYIRHYWHLVGARSFVPVGPVWNIDPPAKVTDRDRRQLRRDLQRAQQLGVIPTLRIDKGGAAQFASRVFVKLQP